MTDSHLVRTYTIASETASNMVPLCIGEKSTYFFAAVSSNEVSVAKNSFQFNYINMVWGL